MPSITLYELKNYNDGILTPCTINLDDFDSHDEYLQTVTGWLARVTWATGRAAEEWIVCDSEDVPSNYIGEYDLSPDYWDFKKAADNSSYNQEIFAAGAELDIEPNMIDELYSGQHTTDEAFAEDIADQLGLVSDAISWPHTCIDWTYAARELMYDYGSHDGHYFRTSY